ncbi:hypothetical protein QBC42DRAFT_292272 [Cladorrhinum samala]|uniref:Uncharacterized protein n=1 Tax=Cladorrhinum samala TaxID=585594 RepID=A0AAV9H7R5_9PEZI|nr:hypothetical protein QBC42DRAFT_292272 [Cladorrhinum samala]
MLLTSGQVSIALSSGIVFFFTLALFLSGYVIQQRTLREIRAAIKQPPKPSPKIFLPDRFKQSTTELEDGTIIIVDEDPDYQPFRPPHVDVEIKPTEPEVLQEKEEGEEGKEGKEEEEGSSGAWEEGGEEEGKEEKEAQEGKKVEAESAQQPPSQQQQKGSGGSWWNRRPSLPSFRKSSKDDSEKSNSQKPMSRAERRRRIREEIMKLAQGDGERAVYQRRLY